MAAGCHCRVLADRQPQRGLVVTTVGRRRGDPRPRAASAAAETARVGVRRRLATTSTAGAALTARRRAGPLPAPSPAEQEPSTPEACPEVGDVHEPADDFLPKARHYGAAHRARLEQFHARGLLLPAGPSSIPGTAAPWASSPAARPPRSSSVATRSCCMAWSAAGGSAHGTSPSPGLTTGLSVGMAVSAERPQLPADPAEDLALRPARLARTPVCRSGPRPRATSTARPSPGPETRRGHPASLRR